MRKIIFGILLFCVYRKICLYFYNNIIPHFISKLQQKNIFFKKIYIENKRYFFAIFYKNSTTIIYIQQKSRDSFKMLKAFDYFLTN